MTIKSYHRPFDNNNCNCFAIFIFTIFVNYPVNEVIVEENIVSNTVQIKEKYNGILKQCKQYIYGRINTMEKNIN